MKGQEDSETAEVTAGADGVVSTRVEDLAPIGRPWPTVYPPMVPVNTESTVVLLWLQNETPVFQRLEMISVPHGFVYVL